MCRVPGSMPRYGRSLDGGGGRLRWEVVLQVCSCLFAQHGVVADATINRIVMQMLSGTSLHIRGENLCRYLYRMDQLVKNLCCYLVKGVVTLLLCWLLFNGLGIHNESLSGPSTDGRGDDQAGMFILMKMLLRKKSTLSQLVISYLVICRPLYTQGQTIMLKQLIKQ